MSRELDFYKSTRITSTPGTKTSVPVCSIRKPLDLVAYIKNVLGLYPDDISKGFYELNTDQLDRVIEDFSNKIKEFDGDMEFNQEVNQLIYESKNLGENEVIVIEFNEEDYKMKCVITVSSKCKECGHEKAIQLDPIEMGDMIDLYIEDAGTSLLSLSGNILKDIAPMINECAVAIVSYPDKYNLFSSKDCQTLLQTFIILERYCMNYPDYNIIITQVE